MIALRKYIFACAVFCSSMAAAQVLPAQQIQAIKPDEGTPPRPSASESPSTTQSKHVAAPEEQLNRIAALLAQRCLACHGPDKQEGNYSIESFARLLKSGDSAKQPVVAGAPDGSEFYRRLITTDASERMPAESDPLSDEELEMIQDWIAGGAQVPAGLVQRPLAEWPRASEPGHNIPEHYPAALPIAALALASDGHSIWTSGYGEVIQWELGTGQLQTRRAVAGTQVADIDISGDGRYMAVSSGTPGTQGVVEVWQLDAVGSRPALWSDISADVAADVAFAPTDSRLAIGRSDGSLLLVDLEKLASASATTASEFTPHADAVLCVAWSESGDRLITGSRDRTAKIFDGRAMDLIANYDKHQRAVGGVAYAGTHPVSFDETGQLRIWAGDDSDRSIAEQSNLPRFLERVASSGKHIYLADGSAVRLFSIEKERTEDGKDESGKPKTKTTTRLSEEQRLESDGRSWIMSLAHRGELLAAGTEAGEVVVWEKNQSAPKFKFSAKP